MFRVLRWLLLGLVQVWVGVLFALLLVWQALGIGVNYGPGACLLLCGAALLTYLALIALHELGHLLVGQALGLPFQRFTVGPLQLAREGGRVRARLNTAWFQPAAYVAHALPREGGRRWRWAVTVFGGPLSNLLVAVACLAAASGLNPGPPADMPRAARAGWRGVALLYPGDPVTAWLNIAGLLSLGLGLGNLVPGSAVGLRTDGGQLLDLWRGKDLLDRAPQQTGAAGDPPAAPGLRGSPGCPPGSLDSPSDG